MKTFTISTLTFLFLFFNISITSSQTTSAGWVSTISGSSFESINDVKTDVDGNIYAVGRFSGTTDFDGSQTVKNVSSAGETDAYICKYTPDGALAWVSTFGGSGPDNCFSLSVDTEGMIYAVGTFEESADFDPSDEITSLNSAGREDIFIAKLDQDGQLIWVKRIGGTSVDEANDIALDNQGNMYIVGRFVSSVDFDPGSGSEVLQAGSQPDAFIVKLTNDGEFIWAHDIGSGDNEEAECVEVDNQNNVIISGIFSGTVDFDFGSGEFEIFGDGNNDPFFLKLDSNGLFMWARSFKSSGFEYSGDIAIDNNNNILAHGFFRETINFNPQGQAMMITSAGAEDCYTAKFSPNGQLDWVNVIADPNISFGYGVATDIIGDVYVTGLFYDSPDFDPGINEFYMPSSGIEDTYLVKYNSNGDFVWSKKTGGSSSDAGYGVDISPTGDIILGGNYWGTSDLDPELNANFNISSKGGSDVFVLKIDQIVSSTEENELSNIPFEIGPNPTNDNMNIFFEGNNGYSFYIVNNLGKPVTASTSVESSNYNLQLNKLAFGQYYIIIEHEQNRYVQKIIVLD